MKTFIDLVLAEECATEDIDEAISAWHFPEKAKHPFPRDRQRTLREYLGMSPEEYSAWVSDAEALNGIIEQHRKEKGK